MMPSTQERLQTSQTPHFCPREAGVRHGPVDPERLSTDLNRLFASIASSRSSHCSVLSASSLVVLCHPSSMITHRGRTPLSRRVANPSMIPARRDESNVRLRHPGAAGEYRKPWYLIQSWHPEILPREAVHSARAPRSAGE